MFVISLIAFALLFIHPQVVAGSASASVNGGISGYCALIAPYSPDGFVDDAACLTYAIATGLVVGSAFNKHSVSPMLFAEKISFRDFEKETQRLQGFIFPKGFGAECVRDVTDAIFMNKAAYSMANLCSLGDQNSLLLSKNVDMADDTTTYVLYTTRIENHYF